MKDKIKELEDRVSELEKIIQEQITWNDTQIKVNQDFFDMLKEIVSKIMPTSQT